MVRMLRAASTVYNHSTPSLHLTSLRIASSCSIDHRSTVTSTPISAPLLLSDYINRGFEALYLKHTVMIDESANSHMVQIVESLQGTL